MKELSITVQDIAGVDKTRPLTGGVPIAACLTSSLFSL